MPDDKAISDADLVKWRNIVARVDQRCTTFTVHRDLFFSLIARIDAERARADRIKAILEDRRFDCDDMVFAIAMELRLESYDCGGRVVTEEEE